jgi:hypothetical protein
MPNNAFRLASLRRWSKANSDGSFSENMAKADSSASRKGMGDWGRRWSGILAKPSRNKAYKASADNCLRTFLAVGGAGRTMAIPFALTEARHP